MEIHRQIYVWVATPDVICASELAMVPAPPAKRIPATSITSLSMEPPNAQTSVSMALMPTPPTSGASCVMPIAKPVSITPKNAYLVDSPTSEPESTFKITSVYKIAPPDSIKEPQTIPVQIVPMAVPLALNSD